MSQNLVPSRFNYFGPWHNGYYLAYNARSGALAVLTADNYAQLQSVLRKIADLQTDRLTDEEQQLLQQLQYGSFVQPADPPELEYLKFECHNARFDRSTLTLVLSPTMACNMACTYCYEETRRGRMSAETVQAALDFVERQAPQLKRLAVSWYGGEPLLALDIIESLTTGFLRLSEKYGFNYSSAVITNGYLLDRAAVDRLCELKVTDAQVTIDGPAEVHDRKRPLANGRSSFDTILRNLDYAAKRLRISVRVNVDKEHTPATVARLLDELESAGLRGRVFPHFALMEPATRVCSNISENCYDTAAFSKVETDYYAMLLERGFGINRLPAPCFTACMAQLVNSYVVDHDGDMYRCFNYVGDKSHSCGNLSAEVDFRHPEFQRLFAVDPFEYERCRECSVLPLCQGACPSRRLDRDLTGDEQCESWRFNLPSMLDLIARSRWQQASNSTQEVRKTP